MLKKLWQSDKTKYLVADTISKGSNYMLLLFFSYVLTVEQYGEISLYNSLVTLFMIVFSFNMTRGYITRAYYDESISFPKLVGTVSVFLLALNGFFLLVSGIVYVQHNQMFDMSSTLISTSIITAVCAQFVDLQISTFNAKRETNKYFIWSTGVSVVLFVSSIVFYYLFHGLGLYSLILARILISVVASGVILWTFKRDYGFDFDRALFKKIFIFSLPLVMHSISGFILNYISRFMLNSMNGLYDAGMYSFAYNFSMFVFIAAVALNNSWTPQFYRLLSEEKYEAVESKVKANFIMFASMVLAFSLVSKEVMMFVFSKQYQDSISIIYLLNINYLMFYAYTLYSNYVFYYHKTLYTFFNTTFVGVVTILLNWWLIPRYNYNGAAFSTILSFGLLLLMYYLTVKVYFKFPAFRITKLAIPFLITCGFIALMYVLDGHLIWLYSVKAVIVVYLGRYAWKMVRK